MTARILIVEDEEPLTIMLRYNLEKEGFSVITSGRGDDADLNIKENPPDLAVIDWMLPGLTGIELVRRLRSRPQTKQLPIIMLTARGEESERLRGLSTGADDYIVKPFSVPELLARIRALLRRASPQRMDSILALDDIQLDRERKRVTRSSRDVTLGPDGISAAGISDGKSGPRLFARATAGWRVGTRRLYRRTNRRRSHGTPAPGAQPRR